jgi:hypothetical protein
VTHRRGRGWRGGFLGSAVEQYIKLDLNKWLKVLRHLELLPRPLGQDWSEIWLQRFSGTITIWPKSVPSDFWNLLSDPSPQRLGRMLQVGQQSTFPKLQFIENRIKIESLIMKGLQMNSATGRREASPLLSRRLHVTDQKQQPGYPSPGYLVVPLDKAHPGYDPPQRQNPYDGSQFLELPDNSASDSFHPSRRNSVIEEMKRQSAVFFDDSDLYGEDGNNSSDEGSVLADEDLGTRVQ